MTRRVPADDSPALRLREPADVLAAIPYVMGYHPADSVVVLALRGTGLLFTAREDLDRTAGLMRESCAKLMKLLRRERATAVVVVGFGPEPRVRPPLLLVRDACEGAGLRVLELLRAEAGRYWSYLCDDPTCCPPEGNPYDPASSPVAAQWTVAGRVVLPDREAYERQLEPVRGLARLAMAQATARAGDRLFDLVTRPIDEAQLEQEFLSAAHTVIHEALAAGPGDAPVDDDTVAWLTVLLGSEPVRVQAWDQIADAPDLASRLSAFWLDVMRRAEEDLRAAPAAMFAHASWRCGDTHLAGVAIDLALDLEPDCGQARQLRRALAQGMAPTDLRTVRLPAVRRRSGRRSRRRSSSSREGTPQG